MKPLSTGTWRSQSGFALLITITLLAFLVLLLVSLATLTRVETQVSANSQQLAQARQNALMALNIALGQVQLMLGPDQRVSMTAAQQSTDAGSASYAAADADNNANWVGVYRQNPSNSLTRDPQFLGWLVSGNQTLTVPASGANAPSVVPAAAVTGLAKTMTAATPVTVGGRNAVLLVGPGSTLAEPVASAPASVVDRFVVAPLQSIQVPAKILPGFDSASSTPMTVGNFAYWVGDEGEKANVALTDPWENPAATTLAATSATTAQAQTYRFVNAQRFGIEGVGQNAADAKLGATGYPATDPLFKGALPRVLSLPQLSLANSDATGQAALASAQRVRFHDLTANSCGLMTDVAKGGFRKDLTAWIAGSTTNPAGLPAANAAYITPGDSIDINKMWLPKWALIRDYASTQNTGAAVAPRMQTASQQGVFPVITFARMGFSLSCANATPSAPPNNGGRYKYHIMPVVALWNPYNVPIQASIDDTNSYELCFRYTHNKSDTQDAFLKVITFGPERDLEGFNLSRIRMEDNSGVAGYTGNKRDYGVGDEQQFWRFRVKLTRDLAPGESRLFTIDDSVDGNQYGSGQTLLSDAVVDLRNSVYIPSGTGTGNSGANAVEIPAAATSVFVNTEPAIPANGVNYFARMQVRLTKPVPSGTAAAAINDFIVNNSYQAIVGLGFNWGIDTNPPFAVPTEMDRDENPICAEQIELAMSSLNTTTGDNSYSTPVVGHPRWLAMLNPQASITLRKPYNETTGAAYAGPFYNATPSYLGRQYIKASAFGYVPYSSAIWRVPLSDGAGNVSAGLQVSTSATGGVAQKLILREFQPAGSPLFSIAQLQHVNVSALSLNPAYAIGNSLANLYVPRDDATAHSAIADQDSYPEAFTGFPASVQTGGKFAFIYDLSYLLNKALWDGYFFSTVPTALDSSRAADPDYRLPNARHQFYWNTAAGANNAVEFGELKATATAAAHLVVNGSFNVNSTSVQAWRAFLYSHNGVDPADATGNTYSRFASPATGAQVNATWLGYRSLTNAQIDALAIAIVAEVRTRGPFLSLADFINRRLATDATGLKGPLQAAIDATSGTGSVNGVAPFTDSTLRISAYPRDITSGSTDAEIYMGGADNTKPSASRAAFAPGYLTQADLLSTLGPSLTARSDTFRIRTYGDTVNPVTGTTESRAWCEAIIQRMPDYVDSTNAATVAPGSSTATNKTFGRRFRVVSFRWLSSNDI